MLLSATFLSNASLCLGGLRVAVSTLSLQTATIALAFTVTGLAVLAINLKTQALSTTATT
jgi:hypothetical protein